MAIRKFKKPIYVDFSLTPYCNLKCGFCYASACGRNNGKELLTLKDFSRIFDEMDELEVLRIGFEGGEPFFRKDIIEILKLADKHNFTYFINTNGTLITSTLAKELKQTDVDKICVSIDGPNNKINDESRGVPGAFELTKKGVKHLLDNNIKINGVLTLSNINKDYIIDTFEYMKDLGIKDAVIMLLATVGENTKNSNKYYLSYTEWSKILLNLTDLKKEHKLPLDVSIVPPGEGMCEWELYLPLYLNNRADDIKYWKSQKIATTLDENNYGCTACTDNFCIDGFGDVYGCSMMISNKKLCGGNVLEKSLVDIWYDSKEFNDIRGLNINNIKGKCKECSLLEKCKGGCRSCAFEVNNDLNDQDPRCPICKGDVVLNGTKN